MTEPGVNVTVAPQRDLLGQRRGSPPPGTASRDDGELLARALLTAYFGALDLRGEVASIDLGNLLVEFVDGIDDQAIRDRLVYTSEALAGLARTALELLADPPTEYQADLKRGVVDGEREMGRDYTPPWWLQQLCVDAEAQRCPAGG